MSSIRSYSLSELLASVRRCIEAGFVGRYWVKAETSDLRTASGAGHCYMELLEKGERGDIVARVRANMWANTYNEVKRRFHDSGLGPLVSGMNILALVQVTYHEQFGLSLLIHDVDPSYSLGDIARLRQETIKRLRTEGLLQRNQSLELPRPLQRLAVVSSASAAGYGDFMRHLTEGRSGLCFYTCLFTAQMQGERTTASVIHALDRIESHRTYFDAVVLIRGGGAVSELRAFDEYELCARIARMSLPVLVGIGHERDQSVADLVAHTSAKTPTAVADFVLQRGEAELNGISQAISRLMLATNQLSVGRMQWLESVLRRVPASAQRVLMASVQRQGDTEQRLMYQSRALIERGRMQLQRSTTQLPVLVRSLLARQEQSLEHSERAVHLAHPEQTLKRGFALVRRAGVIKTHVADLHSGDELEIQLIGGSISAQVK